MNTNKMTQEQISAFADGELANLQVEAMLAALHTVDGRAAWSTYHEIGDMIRSDDLDFDFSPDFSARMKSRLDAENPILAPVRRQLEPVAVEAVPVTTVAIAGNRSSFKRFGLPAFSAAAALAAIGFATAPQLMVAKQDAVRAPTTFAMSAEQDAGAMKTVALASPKDRALRDPRIDDYLLAHQRFSPSVYSTAQYARSATFATDTDK